MAEIYVSTDVETDGPIPGPHSMLSFASAAYTPDRSLHVTVWMHHTHVPVRNQPSGTASAVAAASIPPASSR